MKSLKKRMVFIFSALTLVVCVGLGTTSFIMTLLGLKGMYTRDIKYIAEQTADIISTAVNAKMDTLSLVSNNAEIITDKVPIEKKVEALNNYALDLGYKTLNYIDLKGNVYGEGGKVVYNVADTEYFKEAIDGYIYSSAPMSNSQDGSLVIYYSTPVFKGGNIVAVISATVDGLLYSDILANNKFGSTGQAFIVDKAGTFIGHSNKTLVEEKVNVIEAANKDAGYKELANLMGIMNQEKTGLKRYKELGQKKIIGFDEVAGDEWYVGVSIAESEVYQAINTLFFQLVGITVLFFLICGGIMYGVASRITKKININAKHMEVLASGDLSVPMDAEQLEVLDETGAMAKSIQVMQDSVSEIVSSIQSSSNDVQTESVDLSTRSSELSKLSDSITNAITEIAEGTGVQAGELTEINELLTQFNEKLNTMLEQINNVDESSRRIDEMAESSSAEMNELNESVTQVSATFESFKESIHTLGNSIGEINNITNLITDVANQTNLLALNASIEAARAGEAGKGFAVVAEEIGNLAEQSKKSSQSINSMITTISKETNVLVADATGMGVKLDEQIVTIKKSMDAFKEIVTEVNDVIPKINTVKESASTINENKNVIISKVDDLSAVSEEISASTQEISASTEEMNHSINMIADSATNLNEMTGVMSEQVNRFTL